MIAKISANERIPSFEFDPAIMAKIPTIIPSKQLI
jgi:hypothetical protein